MTLTAPTTINTTHTASGLQAHQGQRCPFACRWSAGRLGSGTAAPGGSWGRGVKSEVTEEVCASAKQPGPVCCRHAQSVPCVCYCIMAARPGVEPPNAPPASARFTTYMQYHEATAITRLMSMAPAHPREAKMKGSDSSAGAITLLTSRYLCDSAQDMFLLSSPSGLSKPYR
jgi:hypothetical protein